MGVVGEPVTLAAPAVVPKEKITSSIVVLTGMPVIVKSVVWFTKWIVGLISCN
jgi:hypothetical protein